MGFKCGIIGLPNVGKSTLFNALTDSNKAEAANYPFATIEPNIGRVPVHDERIIKLSNISLSKKTIPTYIDFIDIAGLVKGASLGEGLGNKFLAHIREVDALIHVVRCFKNEKITHVSSKIDPLQDIEIILTELKLADIDTIQNKIKILEKKGKNGDEKIKFEIKICLELLKKINTDEKLEKNFSEEKKIFTKDLNLISFKPMLYICNVDENSLEKGNSLSNLVAQKAQKENKSSIIVSASIESQISEIINHDEKNEMRNTLGISNSALSKLIISGYDLLDLVTFFTSGAKETRAWAIKKNSTVLKAAGKIHSDFEKGFIRAETISFKDFIDYNGEIGCRDAGKLRQEGKDYVVEDGDIFHFLFNI